ncbi:hypothetical protein MIB92_08735 [Aestuariirhabdus sp. Z084]|uniref:hypothetical protein n=1 Tax=Aestuariirhabdus haliotis TaxID=2918751 RepID=UPI00201B42E0|nr:hypothetical protein [Aestuariirhabdus haliotis]MCL6415735.1 hypothetical protein [Aestuariirhabdus haliotis]MCL6419739.1 hypothetical protein [Aestuariirhabdus haliotis]
MSNDKILELGDLAALAQARIQKEFSQIDPVIGVLRSMREAGYPADAMTIDCFKTGKRILLILHDSKPNQVDYQFCLRDQDPASEYQQIPLSAVTEEQFYQWIKQYFSDQH